MLKAQILYRGWLNMLKSSITLVVLIAGIFSCTKVSTEETLISKWKPEIANKAINRKMASLPSGQCLEAIYNVETLKAQIAELETQYANHQPLTGKWRHIDLSQLPIPQANFLLKYGDRIGYIDLTGVNNFSSCRSVPCLFNKIYKKDDSVNGYVHYFWYLKFGHLLGASNKMPVQNSATPGEYYNKKFNLEDYLFSDKEIYGFWRLTMMLQEPHTNLRLLQEIHRVPRGSAIENRSESSCASASANGWIVLADKCLTFDEHADQGYFYLAMTHELNHHIDFEEGKERSLAYRSHSQDYLTMSGFSLEEKKDSAGVLQKNWIQLPGIQQVTTYAGTLPHENFAESLAYYRHAGDRTKSKISLDQYMFVSKNYYQERNFEQSTLFESWIKKASLNLKQKVLLSLIECQKNSSTMESSFFEADDMDLNLTRAELNCISYNSEKLAQDISSKVRITEPEACSVFTSSELPLWNKALREKIISSLEEGAYALKADSNYLSKIQNFHTFLAESRFSREHFMQCFKEENKKQCYEENLRTFVRNKITELGLSETHGLELVNYYLEFYPFLKVQNETLKIYQVFVDLHFDIVKGGSQDLWKSCKIKSQSDEDVPVGQSFTLKGGYMISSFYNCLNVEFKKTVTGLIQGFNLNGMKVVNDEELHLVEAEVSQVLLQLLQEIHEKESEEEIALKNTLVENDKGSIRSKLLSNFSWVKPSEVARSCREAALSFISYRPIYHLKKELFKDFITSEVCFNISSTSEFRAWLNQAKGRLSADIYENLNKSILKRAQGLESECLKTYPTGNVVTELYQNFLRDRCVKKDWPKIEEEAAHEVSLDDMAFRLSITHAILLQRAINNRKELQKRFF